MVAGRLLRQRQQDQAEARDRPPISSQIAGVQATNRSIAIPIAAAAQQITNGWRGVVGDGIGPLISMHINVPGGVSPRRWVQLHLLVIELPGRWETQVAGAGRAGLKACVRYMFTNESSS